MGSCQALLGGIDLAPDASGRFHAWYGQFARHLFHPLTAVLHISAAMILVSELHSGFSESLMENYL